MEVVKLKKLKKVMGVKVFLNVVNKFNDIFFDVVSKVIFYVYEY